MITIDTMTPATAPTRTRALSTGTVGYAGTVALGFAHVETQLSWSPLPANCVLGTTSRENSLVNPNMTVRPDAAAATGAVPAGAAAGHDNSIGRKQGRPPRGEPR